MTPIRIVMDFEASALNNGYPIEVGVAFTWPDASITGDSKLIRHPPWLDQGRWSPDAQRVHKISRQEIYKNGRPPQEVCDWLNGMLAGRDVYADHDKDKGWLGQLFEAAGQKPHFTLRHVVEIIDSASYVNEDCLVDFMWGEHSGPQIHRAGPDAMRISRALAASIVMKPQNA